MYSSILNLWYIYDTHDSPLYTIITFNCARYHKMYTCYIFTVYWIITYVHIIGCNMRAQSCLSSRATGLSRGILGSWMDMFFKPLQLPWVKQEMPKHSPRHFPGEAMATKKPPDVYNTLMNAANGPRSNEIAVGFLWIFDHRMTV